ncbi:M23 family metallopeptidase [Gaopeijia maritima]|uniref:peptidoglycan DD-metalloendopeptidase family protein n=1 Tax=Gaopeijia maritima TaxID=3119007 RepID=UPI00324A7647
MISTRHTRALLRGLLLGAAVGVSACDVPEVGELETLYAEPAERREVRLLGPGETLGGVLEESLDRGQQQAVLLAFEEQASPRRLKVDSEIVLRFVGENTLRGVDVVLNPDETVRVTKGPYAWASSVVRTPTRIDTLMVAGSIEQSLWASLMENADLVDMPYADKGILVDELDKVFQWQLDFSRQIQPGDEFRVVFERQVRPDGTMRGGHVVAAEFVNVGKPYRALWFDPNGDGEGSYYDEEGNSVRRSFLLKPLTFRRISSRFSNGRMHPVLNRIRAHRGVDYAADSGTPIMATADGVVQHRGALGGLGNAVVIAHANGFTTRYGHMSRFSAGVRVGSRVSQGDVIGYVGMTGLATGPHLHYEMIRNGTHVDPLAVDLPNGDPVPSEVMDRWTAELTPRIALLEQIAAPGEVRTAQPEPQLPPGDDRMADGAGDPPDDPPLK